MEKLRGHVTLATPIFENFLQGSMSGFSIGALTPNLKSVALALAAILAINTKFTGHVTLVTTPFTLF